MPYNIPTTTTNDISFGPAVLFMGIAGSTPSTQVGAITEDGVTIEITSEKRSITQGNPKVPVYTFSQAQGVMVKVTGIEWDYENFLWAVGAGSTTATASEETFSWGGDPIVTQLALHIEHYMAVTGNTLNVYVWEVVSEGGLVLPFTHDEHAFEYNFAAHRVKTDWAGTTVSVTEQLLKLERVL